MTVDEAMAEARTARADGLLERIVDGLAGRAGVEAVFGEAAEFRPIREPYPPPAFLLASAVAAAIVLRALAGLRA